MDEAELWVYLDDDGGRNADLPPRLIAEGRRLGAATGWRVCGVVRHPALAASLQTGGRGFDLDGLHALWPDPDRPEAPVGLVAERLAVCMAAAPGLRLILLPATAIGADLAARCAATLRRPLLSRCVDLEWCEGRLIGRRAVYSGRAHQLVCPTVDAPWVATLDPQVLEAPAAPAPQPLVAALAPGADPAAAPAGVVATWRLPSRELDVLDGEVVLSVGRGVSGEALARVHELAELLHAAVGGSREAVFGGLVERERQVGASGKWIAPRVYVALGISGSTYHLMGIREARHVVAINLDPAAPIMGRAELPIVADVAELLPALIEAARQPGVAGA